MAGKSLPDELLDPLRESKGRMAAVSIDTRRYPNFGGRKQPHECAVCGEFRRCVEIDGTDEWVCGPCTVVSVQVSLDAKDPGPGRSAGEGFVYDDEQCPSRGAGLNHTQNGGPYCVHCGQRCWHRPRKLG